MDPFSLWWMDKPLTVTSSVKVIGDLRLGSVILTRSCLNAKGEPVVVSLTVLYQIGTCRRRTVADAHSYTDTNAYSDGDRYTGRDVNATRAPK